MLPSSKCCVYCEDRLVKLLCQMTDLLLLLLCLHILLSYSVCYHSLDVTVPLGYFV